MVSIIVPIYNTEQYLSKCLESICNQTYSDIEVIMINDGSTDGSKNVADSYIKKDWRFRLYSQENAGVSVARNVGLENAQGEYVLFVDSDDWLEPQMIEKLVHNMIVYNADISCCQYDHGKCFKGMVTEVWDRECVLQNFLIHKQLNGSLVNKLLKKELIGNKRLEKSIKYGEDALFLWKNLLNIGTMVISPEVLYHVTLHDDSASGGGNYKTIRKDCIKVWEDISDDAINISARLGNMARAQLGNMAFFSLYEMEYYRYRNVEHQEYYLKILKDTAKDLKKACFIPFSEKCLVSIFGFNIFMGRLLISLKKKIKG